MEWSSCKVAKRQGEMTPVRHANSTPNSTLKLLKTPRFACCFFRPGNLNLRQNWCPTQVPEASQVYLRLELAIYFRCKKCHFSHPNCFGWWEAPFILEVYLVWVISVCFFMLSGTMQNACNTLQGTNISHLGKRKIIFKSEFWWDMLVPKRIWCISSTFTSKTNIS